MSADHFSSVAGEYAKFRPCYPRQLFQWLANQVVEHQRVWDVGCGSGQASVALSSYFEQVYATDISASQIAQAQAASNIQYALRAAEDSGLSERSVSLITIAQALHWFDLSAFYAEVARVLLPRGVIAAWTYSPIQIVEPELNAVMQDHYQHVAKGWWPPGREHVDNGYRDLAFPFQTIATPSFSMSASMNTEELCGYVRTWSASARYFQQTKKDPTTSLRQKFLAKVGGKKFKVRWDLAVKAGRLS